MSVGAQQGAPAGEQGVALPSLLCAGRGGVMMNRRGLEGQC